MASIPGKLCRQAAALAALLLCGSCSDDRVFDARALLALDPEELDFGAAFVGDRVSREVVIQSSGRTPIVVRAVSPVDAFYLEPASVEIPPGGTGRVNVLFAPVAEGEAAGTLTLGDDASRAKLEVRGTGIRRILSAPGDLDLGDAFLGRSVDGTLRITNGSALPVTLVAEVTGDRVFAPIDWEVTLPPGSTGDFGVRFTPEVRGVARAQLRLSPCGSCDPLEVSLRGRGLLDRMEAKPAALDFGTVIVGGSRVLEQRLENLGDVARTVAEFVVEPPGEFAVAPEALPATIVPNGVLAVPVSFTPLSGGEKAAVVRAVDQAGDLVLEVPVAGVGQESTLVVEPEAVDFGTRIVGGVYRQTVQVSVEGGPIEIATVALQGDTQAFRARPTNRGLPAVLGEPLLLEVTFQPVAAATSQAAVVLTTNHPLHPELAIPLRGIGEIQGPCRVRVRPGELNFGLVRAGTSHTGTIAVENYGTGDCLLDTFKISGESEPFSLVPVEEPVTIAPGAVWNLGVVYAPAEDDREESRAWLNFNTNDNGSRLVTVWLIGSAFDGNLVAIPDPVSFGRVPVYTTAYQQVEFRNEGTAALRIEDVLLPMGTSSTFSVRVRPELPVELAPGAGFTVGLEFRAGVAGFYEGSLEVRVEGAEGGKRVALLAEAHEGPCEGDCQIFLAVCPGTKVTQVTKTVRLDGAVLGGASTGCRWSLRSAPTGSRATPTPVAACSIDFTPDLVGDYVFELEVTKPVAGDRSTCLNVVHAEPYSGLWLETFWDLEADVDLHLLNPAHHPGIDPFDAWSWASTDGSDCFYWSCRPETGGLSWDLDGPADDPWLDVDSRTLGPENIRLDVPSRDHPYWIGVHWLYNDLAHARLQVTTNVYCAGVQAASETVTLLHREHAVLGSVMVNADGTCAFARSDVRLGY
jgi:hypothetical protein